MANIQNIDSILKALTPTNATLVAVSKKQSPAAIQELYNHGQRDFGENYVQELTEKEAALPKDIRWHFIGHLQSNKVKYIAPFVHLIHAVDSFKLLLDINKEATKNNRIIDVLLQQHIAEEDTKHGMDEKELWDFFEYYNAQKETLQNVRICGMMGMATFTENETQLRAEFRKLQQSFSSIRKTQFLTKTHFQTLSMGMSSDYKMALEEGSNMVRIGSALFGVRK